MAFTSDMVSALAEILKPPENADSDSDLDDEAPKTEFAKMGPGEIGPKKKDDSSSESNQDAKKNTKDIWTEEDVGEGAEYESLYDPRPQPEYEILYKQAVTSEDMFLQMGNKNPATASCEDMVVKIKLPDTKISDMTLDVKSKFLDCRTPKLKLGLHLPHPVDHESGKAKWDGDKGELSVTLRMKRELDFMNF
ncbi:dynein axonemal assembly factor 6-like isoform X2 [Ylistrum balloti]|uniref:dynein axonemal assembly factor 6-like isoform X2 n=1 Tax=Ylistrum balloti TaxID=509963 RepID=UPI0029058B0F|nr:dynein axonemal assembly factor 6-like isoform X2 [Ylistrum balloti]